MRACVRVRAYDLEISKGVGLDPLWAVAPKETKVERTALRSKMGKLKGVSG